MTRKIYESKRSKTSGPYSHGVESGNYVHLAGQNAMSASDATHLKGNVAAQTEQCFVYLFEVLEEAGLTEEDVIKVNVYLTTMQDMDPMNGVYEAMFTEPRPARTCVAVKELPDDADVEIEMLAKRRDG